MDYDNQRLDKQAFKEAKAAAKEQQKQAKEERKKQKEELKALKKAKKEQEKADKKAAKTLPYAGQEIDLSQVTVEQIEEAQQALETQAEYVPFTQTSSDVVDGYKAVIDYHQFHMLQETTIASGFLKHVHDYEIVTQPYIKQETHTYACAPVAMTNVFSWLQTNGYVNALKKGLDGDPVPSFTYTRLWQLSNTEYLKDDNGNIKTDKYGNKLGGTHKRDIGHAMIDYAEEQGYSGATFDGYAFVWYSDFKRDIDKNLPCLFGYHTNYTDENGNVKPFDHEVFATGYVQTTNHDFLYVATGWFLYEDLIEKYPDMVEEDLANGYQPEQLDSYLFYHRYIDLKQKFFSTEGGAFHINNSPNYK